MEKISVTTHSKNEIIDITKSVQKTITSLNIKNGICTIFCPHTTAAITINESYDDDVKKDITFSLNKISPDYNEFRHAEGNSDAHVKASLIGASETLIIEGGKIMLGTWQGVYFTEFDGPRSREVWIKVING